MMDLAAGTDPEPRAPLLLPNSEVGDEQSLIALERQVSPRILVMAMIMTVVIWQAIRLGLAVMRLGDVINARLRRRPA